LITYSCCPEQAQASRTESDRRPAPTVQDPIVKQYIDPKLMAMVENLQMHAYAAGTVEL
jgi:hypothetical protein